MYVILLGSDLDATALVGGAVGFSHARTPTFAALVTDTEAKGGPDWAAYYQKTIGREPRPLFERGMKAVTSTESEPGQAIEVGFGDGTETVALLRAGWSVLAIDATPQAAELLGPQVPDDAADRLEIRIASAEMVELPRFDLLYAAYALSFLSPTAFRSFWDQVRARLRPGGFLVVNIFGVHDTWAGGPDAQGMTFLDAAAVRRLLEGLWIVSLDVEDQDGDSFSGPKHWHVFDIVASRPLPS
jgi:SAM-dependent methyltransferase